MSQNKTVGTQLIVLFKLAFPIIIGNIAYATLGITDVLMAGMAGTADQAGVAIGGSFFFPAITFIIGVISALHPVISRYCGANTKEEIPQAHAHAVLGALALSFVLMAILLIVAFFFIHMDTDERMEEVTRLYVITVAFTVPISAMFSSSRAYCEAMGNTKTTLIFGLLAVAINVPLNYCFIFGKFGFPELGGVGCGVATLLSMLISTTVILFYINFIPSLRPYSWMKNKNGVKLDGVIDYLKLGLPLGLSASVESSCFTFIALLLSPLGPIAVSAHTVTMSMTSFAFNIPLSLGIATSIMVGYAIGQNNLRTLYYNIKAAYAAMLIGMSFSVTVLLLGRNVFPTFFSNDESVISFASTLIVFGAANQIFENIQTIQAFILRGFKDTKTILIVTIIAFYGVALTLGVSLCYGFIHTPFNLEGPKGFWVGLFSGLLTASILYRFRVVHHYKQLKSQIDIEDKKLNQDTNLNESISSKKMA